VAQPPYIRIVAPQDGDTLSIGRAYVFSAIALDSAGNPIAGEHITWHVLNHCTGVEQVLGSGNSIQVTFRSWTTYTLTAKALDQASETNMQDSISVNVSGLDATAAAG
jgi:hypothetical protein